MIDIDKLITDELKNDKEVDIAFIKSYVEEYVKRNKLNRFYKKIDLSVPKRLEEEEFICAYNPKDKKVYINDDKLISAIIEKTYLKEKEAFDDNDMVFIYAIYLNFVTHELIHIKQTKLMHSLTRFFDNSPELKIIKDSFVAHDKYYGFYLYKHEYFPTEQNANIAASFEVFDLLERNDLIKDKRVLNEYNRFVSGQIIKQYNNLGKVIISPTYEFYNFFKEKEDFDTIEKQMSSENLPRILYGMPFDKALYYKLQQIRDKKAEVTSVKKLILRSRDYGKAI